MKTYYINMGAAYMLLQQQQLFGLPKAEKNATAAHAASASYLSGIREVTPLLLIERGAFLGDSVVVEFEWRRRRRTEQIVQN